MTVENTNVFSFNYKGYKVVIWYCHHCCGQKPKTNLLWWWQVMKNNRVIHRQGEVNRKDAETKSLGWVDSK